MFFYISQYGITGAQIHLLTFLAYFPRLSHLVGTAAKVTKVNSAAADLPALSSHYIGPEDPIFLIKMAFSSLPVRALPVPETKT